MLDAPHIFSFLYNVGDKREVSDYGWSKFYHSRETLKDGDAFVKNGRFKNFGLVAFAPSPAFGYCRYPLIDYWKKGLLGTIIAHGLPKVVHIVR